MLEEFKKTWKFTRIHFYLVLMKKKGLRSKFKTKFEVLFIYFFLCKLKFKKKLTVHLNFLKEFASFTSCMLCIIHYSLAHILFVWKIGWVLHQKVCKVFGISLPYPHLAFNNLYIKLNLITPHHFYLVFSSIPTFPLMRWTLASESIFSKIILQWSI